MRHTERMLRILLNTLGACRPGDPAVNGTPRNLHRKLRFSSPMKYKPWVTESEFFRISHGFALFMLHIKAAV